MSKYIFLLFGLWFTFTLPAQINVDQEYIRNFRVMVKVDTSGELEVTETITVNALGDQIKRGIKRFVPTSRRTTEGSFAKTPVEIINVSHNGSKSDYHTENESGNLAIYIGSKDIIIPNGVHQYEIVYKTRNQIGFYDNYDEIYWNVTGNEWDFPIQQVSCQVYEQRTSPCREVQVGDERCNRARAHHGLHALEPVPAFLMECES